MVAAKYDSCVTIIQVRRKFSPRLTTTPDGRRGRWTGPGARRRRGYYFMAAMTSAVMSVPPKATLFL